MVAVKLVKLPYMFRSITFENILPLIRVLEWLVILVIYAFNNSFLDKLDRLLYHAVYEMGYFRKNLYRGS